MIYKKHKYLIFINRIIIRYQSIYFKAIEIKFPKGKQLEIKKKTADDLSDVPNILNNKFAIPLIEVKLLIFSVIEFLIFLIV